MDRPAIERLVARWLNDAIVQRNLDVFDELVLGDSEPYKQRAGAVLAALADLEATLDELIVERDHIAWRWSVSGVAASGRRATIRGVNFQRLEHGRIAEHWTMVDTLDLRRADG
ncbi:MAG TPA: ester cyclase [Polyangiaceae bacterium]|nr:ester cyclase [Polyangiaceae bacterium]